MTRNRTRTRARRHIKLILFTFVLLLQSAGLALAGCTGQNGCADGAGVAGARNPALGPNRADGASHAENLPDNPSTLPDERAVESRSMPAANAREQANVQPNTMTIAVKYVALRSDGDAQVAPTRAEVETLFKNISKVWSQCNIRFVVESYETPVAGNDSLSYTPANQSELDAMRAKYDDRQHALFVRTGTWNRSGNLGNDGSNGFSSMPPSDPEGTVLEQSVDLNTLLMAHETGHLIGGLEHTGDSTNLMNHFVSPENTVLWPSQCNDTRTAMQQYHSGWLRN